MQLATKLWIVFDVAVQFRQIIEGVSQGFCYEAAPVWSVVTILRRLRVFIAACRYSCRSNIIARFCHAGPPE